MPNVCRISIVGHVGQDAELKVLPSAQHVLNFSVCVNMPQREGQDRAQWFRCSLFGKRAEKLASMIKKGQAVGVWGAYKIREFKGGGGSPQESHDINVTEVAFYSPKPKEEEIPF